MSVITTGNFAKALMVGVNSWYGESYNEFPVEYTQLFTIENSRRAFEEDVSVSGFGLVPVKAEGAPITYDSMQQGFVTRYTHVEYGMGFVITKNMIEDDLYDIVAKKRAKSLAFSMRQTKEIICANVFNRAFNTSYTGGDGKNLISSAHPNISGGTWSNAPTVASDLSEASLEQAVIDIGKWTNDRGLKIAIKPTKLVIPIDLMFEAERILGSNLRVGTSNNDINAIKSLGKLSGGYIVNHYLTDADAWFLLTDIPDGLKYWNRYADAFEMDNDFETSNAKFKGTMRFSVGWSDPRAVYGSSGA